jgi:hypothetical protein
MGTKKPRNLRCGALVVKKSRSLFFLRGWLSGWLSSGFCSSFGGRFCSSHNTTPSGEGFGAGCPVATIHNTPSFSFLSILFNGNIVRYIN